MTSPDAIGHDHDVPVLIVGAGPVGLIMSILLSRQGIRHMLVEKRGQISELPRARGLTVRSVEILSQMGLAAELDAIAQSELWSSAFVYTETLGGELIGHMLGVMRRGASANFSPCSYVVAAQDRIDPMLFEAARHHAALDLRFHHEVIGFDQDADGITATIAAPRGEMHVRAEYIVAADGGRSPLRAMAGISETGRANLRSFINNFVVADLSRFTKGREGALIWTLKPGLEGVFQMLDEKDRWAIQAQYDPEALDLADWTDDVAKAHIRAMIGAPGAEDVDITVLRSYGYTLSMMLAERLVEGRLLLAGDSAHQIPPYGGFGLNTGLQTAHNLAWKLGTVLRGEAPAALLATFDSERREVAQRVCRFGATNAGFIEQMMAAVRNAENIEAKRAVLAGSRQYGNWWGLDLGVHYEGAGAFVPDDQPAPALDNPVIDYVPTAKPGYRAPHLWIRRNGERVSLVMLLQERFVLLAGPSGQAWLEATREGGFEAPRIASYRVAPDGDLAPEGDFLALYGIGPAGAVLVRPDGMVGWRVPALPANPIQALREALDAILRRS